MVGLLHDSANIDDAGMQGLGFDQSPCDLQQRRQHVLRIEGLWVPRTQHSLASLGNTSEKGLGLQ